MEIIASLKNRWLQIPEIIRTLLAKGILFLIIWKLLYTFWLAPARIPDGLLTRAVTTHTTWILQKISPASDYSIIEKSKPYAIDTDASKHHMVILKDGKPTISIADECNGLELIVLYFAFIFLMPGTLKRKLFFAALSPLLHVVNIVRCLALVGVHLQWPGMFDFAHHYVFKIMVYATCFLLWVWYLKPITGKKADSHA